tara:strand:- start:727 stop:1065 length:339 start_codon:yes stop_codon:yes gene_type:complete
LCVRFYFHSINGNTNKAIPITNKNVRICTLILFIRKNKNCSIVLPSQNIELPIKNTFPNSVVCNAVGKEKQIKATKKKKYINRKFSICIIALLGNVSFCNSVFQLKNFQKRI